MLGLFDPASVKEKVSFGNNCVLNIRVLDADAEIERIKSFSKIVMPATSVGTYRVFQIEDSEGNVVEFYAEEKEG